MSKQLWEDTDIFSTSMKKQGLLTKTNKQTKQSNINQNKTKQNYSSTLHNFLLLTSKLLNLLVQGQAITQNNFCQLLE